MLENVDKLPKDFADNKSVNFTVDFLSPEVQCAIPKVFTWENAYLTNPFFNMCHNAALHS